MSKSCLLMKPWLFHNFWSARFGIYYIRCCEHEVGFSMVTECSDLYHITWNTLWKLVTFCNLDKKEISLTNLPILFTLPFYLLDLSFKNHKCTHFSASHGSETREKKGKPVWNLFFQFFLMLMDLRSREFVFLYAPSKVEILYENALLLWCTFTFTRFSWNTYPPKDSREEF